MVNAGARRGDTIPNMPAALREEPLRLTTGGSRPC